MTSSPHPQAADSQADSSPQNGISDVGGESEGKNAPREQHNGSDVSIHDSTKTDQASTKNSSIWRRIYNTIYWVPPQARFDPDAPPAFSMSLNVLFAFAGAFTVANLYYNHPILNILADDFGVPYEKVSQIPTLAQAGYAIGLFFLCPLGDLFERRPFVLTLVFCTATMR